ncbi:MAG: phosphate ABC transporter permease subunit PstC [Candidatus Izemoplasmatales bacterium]
MIVKIDPEANRRTQKSKRFIWMKHSDRFMKGLLMVPTLMSASFVIFIVGFISRKGIAPFLPSVYGSERVNAFSFLSGTTWFVPPNVYGILFIVINTLYIVALSTLISVPLSVASALFVTRILPKKLQGVFKSIIELLAAIPSVIYGVFGLGIIAKSVVRLAELFHAQTAGGISTLTTIIVLAIMIYPTITMMSVAAISAVDPALEHHSLALGATKVQTMTKVTLASAKPGIFTGIILGVGRALGEATAVSMVAGNAGSGPSLMLFSTTRTLTSTMLLGLKETSGMDYDIRFSVGLVLIGVIFVSNFILAHFKKKVGRFS